MSYKAEYIWVDGQKPTAKLRSKGKVIADGEQPPIWGFDGSSTNQAPGENSDCVLNPVFICPDPIRGGNNKLVLCEVLLTDMTPHPSNTRAACAASAEKYSDMDMWFGIEQEYTYAVQLEQLLRKKSEMYPQGRTSHRFKNYLRRRVTIVDKN